MTRKSLPVKQHLFHSVLCLKYNMIITIITIISIIVITTIAIIIITITIITIIFIIINTIRMLLTVAVWYSDKEGDIS